ncbi:ABC transporter ATP-binding protein [Actinocorallia longicatena]|uniref:ABC transporter ATP-binding protein n=1 Tax=Actinocorallia longicatena TaxID=111803 RepID=A0ABP6QKT8_9ACTN
MAMMGGPGPVRIGGPEVKKHKVRAGTLRRTVPYAWRYRWQLLAVIVLTALHAASIALGPLLLKFVIDDGIVPKKDDVVVLLALLIAAIVVLDAGVMFLQTWLSNRVGQGLLYDLRTTVFTHVQKQPLAFFTRSETGALINRLNSDVLGAQQAVTTLLSQTTSTLLTLVLVLGTMFVLSWQLTLAVLVLIPLFLLPTKWVSTKLERLTRERMNTEAEMASMMGERFNIGGAQLTKLYGQPQRESETFAGKAGAVRDIATTMMAWGQVLGISIAVLTGLTTALLYGFGGRLAIDGTLEIGTIVAMAGLLGRVFGPINQLTNMHVSVLTALVSFDRLFEVLDLQPLIKEKPGARPLARTPGEEGAPDIEFDRVSFRYPNAADVSLRSLESAGRRGRKNGRPGGEAEKGAGDALVLRDVSFRVPGGKLTALVGLSGAGKTTITQLVPRLYDATEGTVRVGGEDVRDLTLDSLMDTIGVVTQDAHLFHDTLRANLLYAREDATERELTEACEAARIWDVIASLPDGLDTVVGDRGHRFSGGEKQRLALARLLLKSSPVVVLDEATAHLDSESEAAIQRALQTALAGRTSLVIAHRLSTIREAHQILVVDGGQIRERGTHDELLAAGGLYADLYGIQYGRENGNGSGTPAARAGAADELHR